MKIGRMVALKKKTPLIFFALFIAAHCHSGWASDDATAPGPQQWDMLAQQKVENFSAQALPAGKIFATVQSSKGDFLKSKPAIKDGTILIHVYVPAPAERGSLFDEIWCKLKTRGAITDAAVAAQPQGEPGACMVMNQAAIDWALKNAADRVRSAYEKTGMRITFLPDQQYGRGDQWAQSSVRVEQDSGNTVTVQASSLRTPEWVPWLGGNQYCKLLSPRGAAQLVSCIAGMCDPALTKAGTPYVLDETDSGFYTEGSRFTVTVGEDAVDIYLPNAGVKTPLAAAVYLQGAKCDKRFYSEYAKLVSSYGFVVAVANHSSLLGKNFTEQKVFNRVWDYLKSQNRNPASPLYKRMNTARVALIGHSYGGVACLGSLQGTCSPPTCIGFSNEAPKELGAVVLYGTNTKSPMSGKFQEVATRGIPVLYINGDRDGKAIPADTQTTFREKTSGGPKVFATVRGANHYSITDMNNPPGGDSDPSSPTLPQKQAHISIARVSGIFMLAHIYNDAAAHNYIYTGEGRTDTAVSVETK